jgi:pimeloyl-ACP methyl ester carboxylesterase
MRRRPRTPYGRTMTATRPDGSTGADGPTAAVAEWAAAGGDSFTNFRRAQRHVLDRYGVDARSRMVRVPRLDLDVHVLVAGDGPPVLMAIGGGMVAALWAPLVAELGGYTAIAFDPPGHGLSGPVQYSTPTLRTTAVELFDGVRDAFGIERGPIVAQSMGGLWATWFALDRPRNVSAISYIGCPALMLGTSAPFPLRLGTIRPLHRMIEHLQPPSTKQVERIGRMAGEPLDQLPELRDLFLAYERLPATSAVLLDLHRALVRVRGARPEVALTADQLRAVTQPVQFVWGERDPFGSVDVGRRAAALMADAELHTVDTGHGPWFTHPAQVGEHVTNFLARHSSSIREEPT